MIVNLKWAQLLLISLLVFAQVHLCQASYTLPDGRVCLTCPSLDHAEVSASAPQEPTLAAAHGDCHDCCVIQACDDHQVPDDSVAQASQIQFAAACLPEALCLTVDRIDPGFAPVPYLESAPSHGPPGTTSSRAPPKSSDRSPSAGLGL